MWVRGLKRERWDKLLWDGFVAPYVGAWIETFLRLASLSISWVAPYVGAWIETLIREDCSNKELRRTLCGCVD